MAFRPEALLSARCDTGISFRCVSTSFSPFQHAGLVGADGTRAPRRKEAEEGLQLLTNVTDKESRAVRPFLPESYMQRSGLMIELLFPTEHLLIFFHSFSKSLWNSDYVPSSVPNTSHHLILI